MFLIWLAFSTTNASCLDGGLNYIGFSDWRVGIPGDGSWFVFTHVPTATTNLAFKNDGSVQSGSITDSGRIITGAVTPGGATGVNMGTAYLLFGGIWALSEVTPGQLSVSYNGGGTAPVVFDFMGRTTFTVPGYNHFTASLSSANTIARCVNCMALKIGDWRLGEQEGHLSIWGASNDKTNMVLPGDGTVHTPQGALNYYNFAAYSFVQSCYCSNAPGAPAMGGVSFSNYNADGSVATFHCDDGYALSGGSVTCSAASSYNSWPTPSVSCNAKPCPTYTAPSGGGLSGTCTGAITGDTCTLSCFSGYALSGPATVTCVGVANANSQWNGAGTCTAVSCSTISSAPANGYLSGTCSGAVTTSTCSFGCNDGYYTSGTTSRTCAGTGSGTSDWDTAFGTCASAVCPSVAAPAGGTLSGTCVGALTTHSCSVACAAGRKVVGSAMIWCDGTGPGTSAWTDTFDCVLTQCALRPSPSGVLVGSVSNSDFHDSTITWECDVGLVLSGDATTTCVATSSDENWPAASVSCSGTVCTSAPVAPNNGEVSFSAASSHGSVATPSCHTGYKLSGGTIQCEAPSGDAPWPPLTASCSETVCASPPGAPLNGDVVFADGNRHASTATFTCHVGFVKEGTSAIACDAPSADSVWPSNNASCIRAVCTSPPDPFGGIVTFSDGDDHGSVATFNCTAGFVLTGTASVTCVALSSNGVWPSVTTPCTPGPCAAIGDGGSYPDEYTSNCSAAPVPSGTTCELACASPGRYGTVARTCDHMVWTVEALVCHNCSDARCEVCPGDVCAACTAASIMSASDVCVASCPEAEYGVVGVDAQCLPCSDGACSVCPGDTCTMCSAGFILSASCVAVCPPGTYGTPGVDVACQGCSASDCVACPDDLCTVCSAPKLLTTGRTCEASCPVGEVAYGAETACSACGAQDNCETIASSCLAGTRFLRCDAAAVGHTLRAGAVVPAAMPSGITSVWPRAGVSSGSYRITISGALAGALSSDASVTGGVTISWGNSPCAAVAVLEAEASVECLMASQTAGTAPLSIRITSLTGFVVMEPENIFEVFDGSYVPGGTLADLASALTFNAAVLAGPSHFARGFLIPSGLDLSSRRLFGCGGDRTVLDGELQRVAHLSAAGTLADVTVQNGLSATTGGAVEASAHFTAQGVVFSMCSSLQSGGAVYTSTNLDVEDCEFRHCGAADGGAIAVDTPDDNTPVSIVRSTFSECVAQGSGGAVWVRRGAVHLHSLDFSLCSSLVDGGAVLVTTSATNQLSLTNVVFSECGAQGDGGAVKISNTSPTGLMPIVVDTVAVTACAAGKKSGGGMFLSGVHVNLRNCTFDQTVSSADGGALYLLSSAATLTDSLFTSSFAMRGGAVFAEYGSINVVRGRLERNTAIFGAALYCNDLHVNVDSVTLSANVALERGGGVYLAGLDPGFVVASTFVGNSCAGKGGAVFVDFRSQMSIESSTFGSNTATGGGVLFAQPASLVNIRDSVFDDNGANSGGALSFFQQGFHVVSSRFRGNEARFAGGVAYSDGSSGNFEDCAFSNNTALVGGALRVVFVAYNYDMDETALEALAELSNDPLLLGLLESANSSTVNVTNCTLAMNVATARGGAVHTQGVTLGMDAVVLEHNSATEGGALYVEGAVAVLRNVLMIKNDALLGGGLFAVRTNIRSYAGECVGNNATTGGGLYLEHHAAVTAHGAFLSLNHAATAGGAYVGANSVLETSESVFADNVASLGGGGLVVAARASVVARSTDITQNVAQFGGGVVLEADGSFDAVNSVFISHNTAERGGGVFLSHGGHFRMGPVHVVNNRAAQGGGMFVDGALDANGIVVEGNVAAHGGGVFLTGGTNAILSSTQFNFNSGTLGGGLYTDLIEIPDLSSCTFESNSAVAGGALYHRIPLSSLLSAEPVPGAPVAGSGNTASAYGPDVASSPFRLRQEACMGLDDVHGSAELGQVFQDASGRALSVNVLDEFGQVVRSADELASLRIDLVLTGPESGALEAHLASSAYLVGEAVTLEGARATAHPSDAVLNTGVPITDPVFDERAFVGNLTLFGTPIQLPLTISVLPCPTGTYLENDVTSLRCKDCPAGEAARNDVKLYFACSPCEPGFFAPKNARLGECSVCPRGFATSLRQQPACYQCEEGTVATVEGSTECVTCDSSSTNCYKDTATARPGFYLVTKEGGEFVVGECPEGFCGANNTCVREHHTGLLCAMCTEGHYIWSGRCTDCSSWKWQLLLALLALLVVFASYLIYWVEPAEASLPIVTFFAQTMSLLLQDALRLTSTAATGEDSLGASLYESLQISRFWLVARNPLESVPSTCVGPLDFHARLAFTLGVCVVLLLLIPLLYVVEAALPVRWVLALVRQSGEYRDKAGRFGRALVSACVFVYVPVCSAALSVLVCREPYEGAGFTLLKADAAVLCSEHGAYVPSYFTLFVVFIIILGVLVYPFPVFVATLAWKSTSRNDEASGASTEEYMNSGTNRSTVSWVEVDHDDVSFIKTADGDGGSSDADGDHSGSHAHFTEVLTKPYRRDIPYWEGILLLRRAILVSLFELIPRAELRLLCMSMLFIMSIIVHLHFAPYRRTQDNLLERTSLYYLTTTAVLLCSAWAGKTSVRWVGFFLLFLFNFPVVWLIYAALSRFLRRRRSALGRVSACESETSSVAPLDAYPLGAIEDLSADTLTERGNASDRSPRVPQGDSPAFAEIPCVAKPGVPMEIVDDTESSELLDLG